ncbi:MAG: UDP-glucose dehydrogenase family protein [Spirochaetia bacterium]
MNVSIIGAGYVGLVAAVCLADAGHNVLCVEKNPARLNALKKGDVPIYEPGLEQLLAHVLQQGTLQFVSQIKLAATHSQIAILCVGTPEGPDGQADLSQVFSASAELAKYAKDYLLIVEKSTVPVETHKKILALLKETQKKSLFDVASNPEFLREGKALEDFQHPDRIVIGADSERAHVLLADLYRSYTKKGIPIVKTSTASAELIKQASNNFLALKISYANMLAELCEKTHADIDDVTRGMGMDQRIGPSFLKAGIGFGGSCFPKDLAAFIRTGELVGIHFGMLREVLFVNNRQRERFLAKIHQTINHLHEKNIAIWGLAFKPETDDIREAPALYIVKELLGVQAKVHLYDPKAMPVFKKIIKETPQVYYANDPYDALENADALLILTEWSEFLYADFEKVKTIMRANHIFDARNCLAKDRLLSMGFHYVGMGR